MVPDPTPDSVIQYLLDRFDGTRVVEAWGERSIFYNPGYKLPRGVYFATVKEKDGDNDKASRLDRAGMFRLNVGTTRPLFLERFGPPPARPGKGGVIDGPWDFTAPGHPDPPSGLWLDELGRSAEPICQYLGGYG